MLKMNRKLQQSLSLQKRIDILHDIDLGRLKNTEIASKYGIAKSTVSMILKRREKIEAASVLQKFEPDRKRMRLSKNEEVETALIRWMNEARNQNHPITGGILQEKARFFADALGVADFSCSTGWLQRFKDRHGIVCKKVCGEEASVSQEISENFISTKVQSILNEYAEADIFNADETSLFWKALPSRTLSIKGMKCSGGKCSKERITVLVACNMTGTDKLPLLVIGKAAKPRCFQGIKTLPVLYDWTKKAWITAELFKKWLKQLDSKFQRENRKVCLILDNCSAHRNISGLKSIHLEYLPPNTTAKLQPCDQGIIRCIKAHYRKEMLFQAISCYDEGTKFSIDLLEALSILQTSWKKVSPTSIQNCFRKAGFTSSLNTSVVEKEEIEFDSSEAKLRGILPEDITFDDYVSMDEDVMTAAAVTDEEIVRDIKCEGNLNDLHYSSDTEEEDYDEYRNHITTTEAFKALKTIRRFVMQTENASESLDAVDKLDDLYKQTVNKKRKQMQITDYFKV